MKEKLSKIRDALEFYGHIPDYKAPYTGGMGKLYFDCGEKAKETVALLNSILAELDSPELVERVEDAIFNLENCSLESAAQAAINTIKGP